MRSRARCPDAAVLAALIDSSLRGEALQAVIDHIAVCDECIVEIGEVAFAGPSDVDTASRPFWHVIAAASVAAIVLISAWAMLPRRESESYERMITPLIRAAAGTDRPVEARLSGGFPWTTHRMQPRGGSGGFDPEHIALEAAAGEVLEATASNRSADALHAAGVAYLVAGRYDFAVRMLDDAIRQTPRNAALWSDLAAAIHTASIRGDFSQPSFAALDAVDRALGIDPRHPEALFNRALILAAAGQRESARHAWRQYLDADSSSAWAAEARSRLE